MGKKLKIDWDEMLRRRPASPPPELAVVPAAGGGGRDAARREEEGEEDPVAKLPDHEIRERIQRGVRNIAFGLVSKLSDGGQKFHSFLLKLQDELDRRNLVPFQKEKDVRDHGIFMQSATKESTDSYVNSSPECMTSKSHSKSSCTFHFSRKLDAKPGAARNDKSRPINQDKCDAPGDDRWLIHKRIEETKISSQRAKTSARHSPFRSASSYTCKKRKIYSNDCCGSTKFPSISSHGGGNSSSSCCKSGISSDNKDSFDSKSNKDFVHLDEENVRHIQSDGDLPAAWKEAKFYYPSRDDPNCVELSYSDIRCLEPESYLSSTIMNFYIKYLQGGLLRTSRLQGRCYFFNTYFFKKLEDAVCSKGDRNTCFLKLRRWWKDVHIFQKAYIFLPVHMTLHWSLLIICIPAKDDQSGPILLHLDSLGLHDSNLIFDAVDRFIKEEWNYLNQRALPSDPPLSDEIWEELPQKIERKIVQVPRQANEYDCGVFVLYYMKRFIKDAPERIGKEDLDMFGGEWFNPEKASLLRGRIRRLLIKQFENASLNDCRTPLSSTSCSSP